MFNIELDELVTKFPESVKVKGFTATGAGGAVWNVSYVILANNKQAFQFSFKVRFFKNFFPKRIRGSRVEAKTLLIISILACFFAIKNLDIFSYFCALTLAGLTVVKSVLTFLKVVF